jgi:ATP-binding cassette subfamily B protein
METVKGQKMELFSKWKWQQLYSQQINSGFRNVITNGAANSLSRFFQQISSLLVLWIGIKLVLNGDLTLGQLIAFRIIAGYVTQPLLRLTTLWQSFQETFISLERISDIVDSPQEIEIYGKDLPPLRTIDGRVEYKNVCFKYFDKSPYVLKNINFEIQPKQFVGVVGLSGSGKSTLFKLLSKTYPVNEGNIFIDGYDIDKFDVYSLRNQVGYVPQDSVLFEGSILENISITSPESTFEDIENAAKIACADEFIQAMHSGYKFQVGEKGVNLSGGQKQRIAIARTILTKPRFLILDESTSALDAETEKQLIDNLLEFTKDTTLVFITHRLSSIKRADKILLVDKGTISEMGKHENLMNQSGRYATLFSQQNSDI